MDADTFDAAGDGCASSAAKMPSPTPPVSRWNHPRATERSSGLFGDGRPSRLPVCHGDRLAKATSNLRAMALTVTAMYIS
jgi:hypothetical protein